MDVDPTLTTLRQGVPADIGAFRGMFIEWLQGRLGEFDTACAAATTLADEVAWNRRLYGALWASGFGRIGWPSCIDGLTGSIKHRAIVAEELMKAGLANPDMFPFFEAYAPPFAALASRDLLTGHLGRYLSGKDWWAQGFSEPEAGSDLASLKTKAIRSGDHYVISGQKIWTSLGQYAEYCLLLARTGSPESRHKGITAFLINTDWPGVEVRPIRAMSDSDEFCEVFLDEVKVPIERRIGEENSGWRFALEVLSAERGPAFWARNCWLGTQLSALLDQVDPATSYTGAIGLAYQNLVALRGRSLHTLEAMSEGKEPDNTSIDKILMATAEQSLFDAVWEALPEEVALNDTATAAHWRSSYLYSRSSSIYGGTGEIQRSIVAERTLGLPR